MTEIRATELQYEAGIIEAAKAAGWLVHAERAAVSKGKWSTPIKGHAGWPDLVLVHEPHRRMMIVELKRKPNKVSDEQRRWLDALDKVTGSIDHWVECWVGVVWVPEQYETLLRLIAQPWLPFAILEET